MAWEDWRDPQNASTWNEILDLLEEGARRFSLHRKRDLEITVTRARWDTADVELRWGLVDRPRGSYHMADAPSGVRVFPVEGLGSFGVGVDVTA